MVTNENSYKHPEYLVETDWLEQNLNDSKLRLFDCTAYPAPNPDPKTRKRFPISPKNGRHAYDEGHIPGAAFIDVPGELADKSCDLPMMMLPAQDFVEILSAHGIDDDSRVVLYASSSPIWPARLWWMLRAVGFDNVAVLNGGLAKWRAEGRPVSTEPCTYAPDRLTARPRSGIFVGKDEVLATVGDKNTRLIHALSPDVYSGASDKLIFGRRGHITGSVNVPSGDMNDPDTGTYLPAGQLHEIFKSVGADKAERIITYCGGGVNASNDAFALALLGYENIAIYDGSMNEWGNDETLPMETG